MKLVHPQLRSVSVVLLLAAALVANGCKENKPQGAGLVVADAGPAPVPEGGALDLSKCTGCQAPAARTWTFEGVYRDAACTEPLAQATVPACAVVDALAATSLSYVDEVGLRKANEVATGVTLKDQIAADAPRFRKTAKTCVRANEGAIDVTPASCFGQRVCRDEGGALSCATCRTFASGCPDFEETRLYASYDDPGLKAKPSTGGNVGRLSQCCAAIGAEARRLGASPEGGMLLGVAAQCQLLVNAAGPNGTAPELSALRAALAGRNIPGCAGL
jgi:hypothetical protein